MNWDKIHAAVIDAVNSVETKHGRGKGKRKRKFAVDLINALVDIPIIPESVEALIIGLLIDQTVLAYNRMAGRNWGRLIKFTKDRKKVQDIQQQKG